MIEVEIEIEYSVAEDGSVIIDIPEDSPILPLLNALKEVLDVG